MLLRWLPWATGVVAYLGVAPFVCDGSGSFPGRIRDVTLPGRAGCSGVVAWQGSTHLRALALGVLVGVVTFLACRAATRWDEIGPVWRSVARVALLGVTLLSFASYAGLMAGTFPLVGPLIVLMIRVSTPIGALLWATIGILAALLAGALYTWLFPTGLLLWASLLMCGTVVAAMLLETITRIRIGVAHFLRS